MNGGVVRRRRVVNPERFRAYFSRAIRTTAGCLEWAGYIDRDGYGNYAGRGAHRLAYTEFVGPIPFGLTVDHKCYNTRCVEPSHLRLLTRAANGRNTSARRVLVSDGECINGHIYDGPNTYVRPNGQRDCRACIRARVAAYKARKTAA